MLLYELVHSIPVLLRATDATSSTSTYHGTRIAGILSLSCNLSRTRRIVRQVLLFFQSKAALFDADVLTQVFWCSKRGVPIVPVTLMDGEAAFDFVHAQRLTSNLEMELECHREGLAAIVASRCRTEDLQELQATLWVVISDGGVSF